MAKGEVGKLLAFLVTAYNLAVLAGMMGSGAIYYNTVSFFAGTMFLVAAAIVAVAWITLLAVHVLAKREGAGYEPMS